jgi:hypothetical protein
VSRDEVAHWLGEHWGKALIVGAFIVGGWVARVEAKMDGMDAAEVSQETVRGIGRLVCAAEPEKAALAGIPCGELLNTGAR